MTNFVDFIKETSIDLRSKIRGLFSGVDEFIDDRLKSPFIWSYIVSWLFLNWEFPAKIIFEGDAVNVVWLTSQIDSLRTEDYLYPLLISVFYVLIFRPLSSLLGGFGKWMMGFSHKINDRMMRRRSIPYAELAKEKKLVKSLRDAARREYIELNDLQKKFSDLEDEYSMFRSSSENDLVELEELRKDTSSKDQSIKELKESLSNTESILSSINMDIASLFDSSGKFTHSEEAISRIKNRIDISEKLKSIHGRLLGVDEERQEDILFTDDSEGNNSSDDRGDLELDAYIIEKRVLLSISDSHWFKAVDVASDLNITKDQLVRAINSAIGSGWVKQSGSRHILTEEGRNKVQEIVASFDQAVPELNIDYVEGKRNAVMEILNEGGITLPELKHKVTLFWDLKGLIDQLVEEGKVSKTGNVYRLSKNITPS